MSEPGENQLPPPEEQSVKAIGQLHAAHARNATRLEKCVEHLTRQAGTPAFLLCLTSLVLCWIALNVALPLTGREPFDEAPFPWLQGALALSAFYVVILILTTQLRDDQLSSLRDQLTLELAILSEQKSAKIIALLEELRRDDPALSNRPDDHARTLSNQADTQKVLDALEEDQVHQ
jgi:uncharacterized membrane protein